MDCIYCGTSTAAPEKAVCDDCADTETAPFDLKLTSAFAGIGILLTVVSALRLLAWPTGWQVIAMLLLVLAALQTAVVYGVFHLDRWAWPAGIVVFAAAVLLALGRAVAGDLFAVVEAVVAGVVLAYLATQKHVYYPEALRWYPPRPLG